MGNVKLIKCLSNRKITYVSINLFSMAVYLLTYRWFLPEFDSRYQYEVSFFMLGKKTIKFNIYLFVFFVTRVFNEVRGNSNKKSVTKKPKTILL